MSGRAQAELLLQGELRIGGTGGERRRDGEVVANSRDMDRHLSRKATSTLTFWPTPEASLFGARGSGGTSLRQDGLH